MGKALSVPAVMFGLALLAGGCAGDDEPDSAKAERDSTTTAQAADRPATAPAPDEAENPGAGNPETSAGDDDRPAQADRNDPAGTDTGSAAGEAAVRATLSTFLSGMRRADPGTVCSTYTRELRALVGRTLASDCATAMDFAFGALGVNPRAFRTVRVGRLEITGDRSVAELVLPPRLRALPLVQIIAPSEELTLQREAGRWRLGLAVL